MTERLEGQTYGILLMVFGMLLAALGGVTVTLLSGNHVGTGGGAGAYGAVYSTGFFLVLFGFYEIWHGSEFRRRPRA